MSPGMNIKLHNCITCSNRKRASKTYLVRTFHTRKFSAHDQYPVVPLDFLRMRLINTHAARAANVNKTMVSRSLRVMTRYRAIGADLGQDTIMIFSRQMTVIVSD